VIGRVIEEHMRTDLVEDALQTAISLRGEPPEQVVLHIYRREYIMSLRGDHCGSCPE